MTMDHCLGTKNNGDPCSSKLGLSAAGLCLSHDPERQAVMRAAQIAGGRAAGERKREAKANAQPRLPTDVPPRMRTLEDSVAMASWITDAVLRRSIDARTGEASIKACRQFQLAIEKRGLLDRIKVLEGQLEAAGVTSIQRGPRGKPA